MGASVAEVSGYQFSLLRSLFSFFHTLGNPNLIIAIVISGVLCKTERCYMTPFQFYAYGAALL